jgi:tripartite-type tricarboxylate transporter receptor subunit TctC
MHDKLPFDLDRDFSPIGLLATTPMMIAVSADSGVGSLGDLVALARTRPEGVFYAANNRGSLPHLTAELWRDRAGVPGTFVPYPGFAAGLQDVLGGRVSVIVESVGAMAGAVKGSKLKPLAIASKERLAAYPDVPTVSETVPGFVAVGWMALVAPSGTSAETVQKLNADLHAALSKPELMLRYEALGAASQTMSLPQIQAYIRAEQELWRPVVRQIGLKSQ